MTIEDVEIMRLKNRLNNPKGTTLLVELEIKDEDGYNTLMGCMFGKEKIVEFEKLTGCCVNRIYMKDIKVPETNTLGDIIEALNKKYQQIRAEGYQV